MNAVLAIGGVAEKADGRARLSAVPEGRKENGFLL
jgi:hypothetical protein